MRTVQVEIESSGAVPCLQGGAVLIVESISLGAEVSITWLDNGQQERGTVLHASKGRKYRPGFMFAGFSVVGTVGAVVVLLIGDNDASDADTLDGVYIENTALDPVKTEIVNPITLTASSVTVNANGAPVSNANPLPVSSPSPLDTREKLATVIANGASVPVTDAVTALLAADATRRAWYGRNTGANAIALVAAGGTFAAAALIVLPGETWREVIAPGAAWKAICDTGLASTMTLFTEAA